jgi:hypothetical protein
LSSPDNVFPGNSNKKPQGKDNGIHWREMLARILTGKERVPRIPHATLPCFVKRGRWRGRGRLMIGQAKWLSDQDRREKEFNKRRSRMEWRRRGQMGKRLKK